MSESYERLGAVRPADTNEADLYALTQGSVIGAVHVCNQTGGPITYRVAVTDTGAGVAADNEDFIEYDVSLPANTTYRVIIEGLKATGTIRIRSGTADAISFVLMGLHIT